MELILLCIQPVKHRAGAIIKVCKACTTARSGNLQFSLIRVSEKAVTALHTSSSSWMDTLVLKWMNGQGEKKKRQGSTGSIHYRWPTLPKP